MKIEKRLFPIIILGSVAVLAAAIVVSLLVGRQMRGQSYSASRFPIAICEVMSTNTRYADPHGVCCDWVELHNSSDTDIDIGGYKLADKTNDVRYSIPRGTVLPGGGYYVVYCLRGGGEHYADFGISRSGGETLVLMNRRNVLVDSVTTVVLEQNQSMARTENGQWQTFDYGTPGYPNTEEGYAAYGEERRAVGGSVVISEVLASNSFYYNEDGFLCDFVEIYNGSDAEVNVGGYMLTDSEQIIRFTFPPDTFLPAHGYETVYCSREHTGAKYADFSISRSGREEILLLNSSMQIADRVTTVPVPKNHAQARDAQGVWTVLDFATPGYPNTAEGYTAYLNGRTAAGAAVIVSEVMAVNTSYPDASGALADWIELCNTGTSAADISGYGVSDSEDGVLYTVPAGTVLEPGACFVIYCTPDGTDTAHAPFGLSAEGGETIVLTDPAGTLLDAVRTVLAPANYAQVRQADGTLLPDALATPGYPNTDEGRAAYTAQAGAISVSVRISEWMPANASTLADADGDFSDWVELENTGAEPLLLSQLYLSDAADDPYAFRLPGVTLAPGERAVVFCSGKNKVENGQIHASFSLSKSGETVLLTTARGETADSVTYRFAEDDRAYAIDPDSGEIAVTAYPTPGFPNTASGVTAFLQSRAPVTTLAISEAAPSNSTYLRQRGGLYYDFVELINLSSARVSIGGSVLTDSPDDLTRCVLPDVTLEPGETFTVCCSGDASLSTENAFHCGISLDAVEDALYLYDASGRLLDYVHIYGVPPDGSIGRSGGEAWFSAFAAPTPGRQNPAGGASGMPSDEPVTDTAAGVYDGVDAVKVALSAKGDIYYTLDGGTPTQASQKYVGPITVTKTQVIRAVSVEEGKLPSPVLTLSYIVNEGHELPVVSLAIDPEDFMGTERGIYSNPLELWERQAHVSFFDGETGFESNCGLRISGQTSRERPHKSFKMAFEPKYGDDMLEYELYEGYKVTTFASLQLRAGLDSVYAVCRESFYSGMAMPYKDTTLVQNFRSVVVYINGEYYGLYLLAEAYSEEFYARYFDVSPESVTIVKGYLYDTSLEMYQLIEYAVEHDMSDDANYRYLDERIDMDSLIDWMIFQSYFRNADLSGNVRYIRSSERCGNKWQFALYDTECGMRLAIPQSFASFGYVVAVGQTADLIAPLLRNETFCDKLLTRLAYHCKVTFEREKLLADWKGYTDELESEVERSFARWDEPVRAYRVNVWHVDRLIRDYDRPMQLIDDITARLKLTSEEREHYFGELLHG